MHLTHECLCSESTAACALLGLEQLGPKESEISGPQVRGMKWDPCMSRVAVVVVVVLVAVAVAVVVAVPCRCSEDDEDSKKDYDDDSNHHHRPAPCRAAPT